MRPTIPLGPWRIALNLSATRSIQNQPGQPAYGCTCKWCENWSRVWETAFPAKLHEQLERICIDIAHPSELYAFEEVPGGAHCRVVYHVAGKLLSGPIVWHEDPAFCQTLLYHQIDQSLNAVGLAVIPCTQTWQVHPESGLVSRSEILQVDFRLFVSFTDALTKFFIPMRPNMALQPTANGLPGLGLHFILAQTHQAVVCG